MSQRELAAEWVVSAAAIAKWELGSHALPGPIRKLMAMYEAELAGAAPARDGPSSLLSRGFNGLGAFGIWTLFRYGFGAAGRLPSTSAREVLMRQLANRVAHSRGLLMKLAQAAGFLDPLLSSSERDALAKLREGAKPMSTTAVFRIFRDAFGVEPHHLFAEWGSVPVRRGSVGQVHRARTKDGRHVAVKVQYPSVRKQMETDLHLVRLFDSWLAASWPAQEQGVVFAELSERFLEECDYESEARHGLAMKARWEGDPRIFIPAPIAELSRGAILTTDWCPGRHWEDFVASATVADRLLAAEAIWDFYVGSLYRFGVFNADPHPGNVLFERERTTFLDFGRVKSLTREFYGYFVEVSRAVCERDWLRVHRLSVDSGLVKGARPVDLARHCCWLWLPMLVDSMRLSPEYCIQSTREILLCGPAQQTMSMNRDSVFMHQLHLCVYTMLSLLDLRVRYRDRLLKVLYPKGDAPPPYAPSELASFGIDLHAVDKSDLICRRDRSRSTPWEASKRIRRPDRGVTKARRRSSP
jgi:hypothetical protein